MHSHFRTARNCAGHNQISLLIAQARSKSRDSAASELRDFVSEIVGPAQMVSHRVRVRIR
jgi:hypothetical protein